MATDGRSGGSWLPFLAGVIAGGAGIVLAKAFAPRRGVDPRLIGRPGEGLDVPPVIVVPGILGSSLVRPDGTQVWLNVGNALGHYDLGLPLTLPLSDSHDDLVPGGLLGVDAVLPRLFGFTEYADLLDLLEEAGFRRASEASRPTLTHHVFTYDWRRDLVESARRLHETLEAIADARGNRDERFNVVGHSMGGLVARYYLRYGTAGPEDGAPVTWAGARRIRNLLLVATPSGGSIPSLDAVLNGQRVGLSTTTLAAAVIARLPAIYQLLPPPGAPALLDHRLEPLTADLHDTATWERFGWGPFATARHRRREDATDAECEALKAFLPAALARARAFHSALVRRPDTPCPARVLALGGDCLPTLARAIVPAKRGVPPRFEPWSRAEGDAMLEAGDGRVARSSVLASYLAGTEESETGSGIPEVAQTLFGSADHHGIYGEPTFQSVLLRTLLRPVRRRAPLEDERAAQRDFAAASKAR